MTCWRERWRVLFCRNVSAKNLETLTCQVGKNEETQCPTCCLKPLSSIAYSTFRPSASWIRGPELHSKNDSNGRGGLTGLTSQVLGMFQGFQHMFKLCLFFNGAISRFVPPTFRARTKRPKKQLNQKLRCKFDICGFKTTVIVQPCLGRNLTCLGIQFFLKINMPTGTGT